MAIFHPTYQVTSELMAKAAPHAKFMHCLPATRGEEVAAEVLEADHSIAFDAVENRLAVMRGLLVYFMPRDLVSQGEKDAARAELDEVLARLTR